MADREGRNYVVACAALAWAAGCVADAGGGADTRSLDVQLADPQAGFVATMSLGPESVRLESRTGEGFREVSVTGRDGTSYATWRMALDDGETVGSYGERTFGRWEDRETDGDTRAWSQIAQSRVGEVLRAASAAARAELDASIYPEAVDDELRAIAEIYPSLLSLTRADEDDASYNACYFGYGAVSLQTWATRYPDYGYCTFNKSANTCAPLASCTRTYHVAIFRDYDGAKLAAASNSSGGCATAFHQGRGNGCFSWTSKHWDSLNPGGPHWKHATQCCSVIINL